MELQRRGTLKAQADTMIDMKKAMNANESFTEFMRELSPVDVIGDRLGVRVNNNSALVRMWKELGGTFTEGETQHITTAKTSGEPTEIIVGDELLDLIQNNSFEEAEGVSQNIFESGVSYMEATDIANHPAVKASMFETLGESIHPNALSVGIFGAYSRIAKV